MPIGISIPPRNDAYNSLALSGQNQAFSEAQASRNQPINEITALMAGSQVSQPNYAPTNMPTIPTTDYAGIVNNNFNQQMQGYQSQLSQNNALMGGMFSLASAPLYGLSDKRAKTDIEKVGKAAGHNVYKFRYKSGGPMQLGLIAQDVERNSHPPSRRCRAVLRRPTTPRLLSWGLHNGSNRSPSILMPVKHLTVLLASAFSRPCLHVAR